MTSPPSFDRYRDIVPDFDEFRAALDRPLPICVWANPLKTSPSELEQYFETEDIGFEPVGWRPGTYRLADDVSAGSRFGFLAGLYQIQEEVSLLPVELLALDHRHRILDTCAAPGSKTTQIAAEAGPQATIVANDRNFHRMAPLGRALDRLGITNTAMMTHDATNLPGSIGHFDRVLADVPCSCEATSRKNPDVDPADHRDFDRLFTVQRAILKRALELTRSGGRVVYSTCSYAPEENEAVVDSVLDEFGDRWNLIPARLEGFRGCPGLVQWRDRSFDQQLRRALRVYPHLGDTGGFFVAVFEHRSR